MASAPSDIDVVILCGGKGTRLQGVVSDRPKPMAEVAGRPFLDFLIDQAASAGFRRILLSAGYRGEQIRARYEGTRDGVSIEVAVEPEPLGTGGALRHSLERLRSDPVLVMNGDSFCDVDLAAFLRFYGGKGGCAALVLAKGDGERFGRVEMDASGAVLAFREKERGAGEGHVNAGIYLLARGVLEGIPRGRAHSLERELFPSLIGRGFHGMAARGDFIDIGLPETYGQAQQLLRVRIAGPRPGLPRG